MRALRFFIIGLLTLFSLGVYGQKELTTFILIRHAEKVMDGSKNPELTEAGKTRALSLVEFLKNTNLDAVYSTAFIRTESTVKPLANSKSLVVKYYEPFKTEVIDKILSDHKGKSVVICGHSNNIPWIANYLTGTDTYKDFADSEYGNILIITVAANPKESSVTWLRY